MKATKKTHFIPNTWRQMNKLVDACQLEPDILPEPR